MKITRLEIIKVPPSWVWLRIHTDTEHFGLGEPFLEGHPDTVIAEVKRLEPLLIGKDPTQVEKLWKEMYESGMGYLGGPIKLSAISGIDMALWDIRGKALNVPIYALLGGAAKEFITPYASLLPTGRTLQAYRESLVDKARQAREFGYQAGKMEVCIKGPYSHNALQEDDAAIVDTEFAVETGFWEPLSPGHDSRELTREC